MAGYGKEARSLRTSGTVKFVILVRWTNFVRVKRQALDLIREGSKERDKTADNRNHKKKTALSKRVENRAVGRRKT